jgi:ankyrin repeat protein
MRSTNDIGLQRTWLLRLVCQASTCVKFLVVGDEVLEISCACVDSGHLDCLRLLLEHGADVNAEDCGGFTPAHEVQDGGT